MFAPESHFWICGYDTFGFALFQCLVLDADGRLTLLTRAPDLLQAQQTSTLSDSDIHVWKDVEGVEPASALADLVEDLGLAGVRIGIETNTVGLTGFNWDRIRSAFEGRAELVEASEIVPTLRRVKSAAEIECCRRAAALSDDALDAAIETTTAGAFEGDILAAMQGAVVSWWWRLRRQRIHHWLRPRGSALPLRFRPARARRTRPTYARVVRCMATVSRRNDAHLDCRTGQRSPKAYARGGR